MPISSSLDLENQILTLVCRPGVTPDAISELRGLIEQSPDWRDLLIRARLQKVDGLLFRALHEGGLHELVPAEAWSPLHAFYRHNSARWMMLQAELGRILRGLNEAGIPVLLLKGAALMYEIYRDGGLRRMADIDLLVPDDLALQSQALVESLGYEPAASEAEIEEMTEVHRHLPALVGKNIPVVIEMHRHIVRKDSPVIFDIGTFWERAKKLTVQGKETAVFSPEDQLIHLCLNFMLDRRFRTNAALSQLADIAAVIEFSEQGIDWEQLRDRVEQTGTGQIVGVTLRLVSELAKAKIPENILQSLAPEDLADELLSTFVKRRVLNYTPFHVHGVVGFDDQYTWGKGVRNAVRRIVPSRQYLIRLYGPSAAGLIGTRFYFVRVWQAVKIAAASVSHPGRFKEDVQIDRLIHNLYERP